MEHKRIGNKWLLSLALVGLVFFMQACKPDPFPRPKGYPRIDLPPHAYSTLDLPSCPFTLEYPAFGAVSMSRPDSCIADLYFKDYDFTWHLTYRHIPSSGKDRSTHEEEYRKLVYKHAMKLSHLNEFELDAENGTGLMYELHGNVGPPAQLIFGDRDSTHLLMVSFYFRRAINQDSLKPLIQYVKTDMEHMAGSVKWR